MKPQPRYLTQLRRTLKANKHLFFIAGILAFPALLLRTHTNITWIGLLLARLLPAYLAKLPKHKQPDPPACLNHRCRNCGIKVPPSANKQPRFIRHAHAKKKR